MVTTIHILENQWHSNYRLQEPKSKMKTIDQSRLIVLKCPICQSKLIPAQMIVMSWINYDCPKCGHVAPKQLRDVYDGYDDSLADIST